MSLSLPDLPECLHLYQLQPRLYNSQLCSSRQLHQLQSSLPYLLGLKYLLYFLRRRFHQKELDVPKQRLHRFQFHS